MELCRTMGALASVVLVWATMVSTSAASNSITYRCQTDDGVTYTLQVSAGTTHQVRQRSNGWLQETTPGAAGNPRVELADCRPLSERELNQWPVGTPVAQLYFAFDQAELSDAARATLTGVVPKMLAGKQRFVLEGHTDSRGTEPYNQRLGLHRAESVAEFLADQGVATEQLETLSQGEIMPVAGNRTPAQRAQNRRVDIIVR